MALLAVAAYADSRTMRIPKALTVPLFALGVVAGIARGAWLAVQGDKLWLFRDTSSPVLGGLDGLLYALAGAALGFVLVFILWVLGTCGGGDVKLFAAVGAWLGPLYVFTALFASLAVLVLLVVLKVAAGGASVKAVRGVMNQGRREWKKGNAPPPPPKPTKWRITYSFPVAVATAAVLLWLFRAELKLVAFDGQSSQRAHAHAI